MNGGFLDGTFAGNTVLRWLITAGVILVTVIVLKLLKAVAMRSLGRLARRTATWVDDVLLDTLASTGFSFYMAVAILAGLVSLELSASLESILRIVATIFLLLQAGVWIQETTRSMMEHWNSGRDSKRSSTIAAGVVFAVKLITWSVVTLLILSNMGVEITAVIAGLGVGGVAVALAAQGILGDLFASLSMYFDRPFDIGDFIIVDDFLGIVEKIGLRSTRLKSLGGEQIVFSNGDIVNSRIRNYARMEERRVVFSFGIEYNLPADKVEKAAVIAREVIEGTEGTRFDRAHFKAYGDFSLNFEAVYYVLVPEYNVYMAKQHAINMGIYRRFEEEGIPFAFPTRTIHLKGGISMTGGEPAASEQ